jgi:3-isopropylmalate/(R)-2-methylmalate dehydratase small subunit
MKAVRAISATAVPLDRSDVDTDQIIPSDWLKRVERTGFGKGLFGEWRDDRSFVLNDQRFAGARILVAGENFGTGSSREHAVWAIMDYGFEAVISPRFGDIFRNNSTKNGLVPVQVSAELGARLLAAIQTEPTLEITVDIERLTISVPTLGIEESFPMDAGTQHRFLNGLDDIGITLTHVAEITKFEQSRPSYMPSTTAR